MNYKHLAIAMLAIFMVATLQAQTPDIIKFKNGSFVRGTIVEYIEGSHVRVKTEEGIYKTFPADQLKSSRPAKTPSIREEITVPTKAFYSQTTLGLLMGQSYYQVVNPSIVSVNGYQFGGRYHVGAGLGMEFFEGEGYLPTFLEAKAFLNKDRSFSPFLAVNAGYSTRFTNRNPDYYYDFSYLPGEEPRNRGGLLGGVQLGLRNYTKQRFGYIVSAGYRMQQSNRLYHNYTWHIHDYYPVEEQVTRHRFELRFGLFFN